MPQPGTVLVVDDREANRELLKAMLEGAGHRVLCAADGSGAIDTAIRERPEVILLDVKMPGMDGFEVCSRLQALSETASIPIIFVTANYTEEQDVLHGLEIGAYDYLVKPVSRSVLLARVGVMLRIRRTDEHVRQLSMIDDFTGLFSKNYVVRRLEEEMQRAQRRESVLTVTMLDLDDFKRYNDTFGHLFGDEILKRVSATLKANIRMYDSLGRYGGEEFLIVQPELAEADAVATLDRLKEKLAEVRFADAGCEGGDVRVTFSAGAAQWDGEVSATELIRRADRALYQAKRLGKDQTVRHSQLGALAADARAPR